MTYSNKWHFKKRPKKEEINLIVLDKYAHEENLSQPSRPEIKLFEKTFNFLTGYTGIFNVTKNIRFVFL